MYVCWLDVFEYVNVGVPTVHVLAWMCVVYACVCMCVLVPATQQDQQQQQTAGGSGRCCGGVA